MKSTYLLLIWSVHVIGQQAALAFTSSTSKATIVRKKSTTHPHQTTTSISTPTGYYEYGTTSNTLLNLPSSNLSNSHKKKHLPISTSTTSSSTITSTTQFAGVVQEEEAKCPVTKFSNKVIDFLLILDKYVIKRIIRIANHVPALASLSYFGLISMSSMMNMGPMSSVEPIKATLSSVLTQVVGPTTNSMFAQLFPTYVTPANFVFLVWPVISILQLLTVSISALNPSDEDFLNQADLSALTIANLFSTAWLIVSSNASPEYLPIGSFLVLPLVPLFSAYPLRNKPKYVLWAYQLFSSFTTLASFLALAVELQHGGRIPLIGTVPAEVAALTFLGLFSASSLAVPEKSSIKKIVNFGALSGILSKRIAGIGFASMGLWSSLKGLSGLFTSVSFIGTIGCWAWSAWELFVGNSSEN